MDIIKRLKSKEAKASQQNFEQANRLNSIEQSNQKNRVQAKQEGIQGSGFLQVQQSLSVNRPSSSNNLMDQTAQIHIQKQDSNSAKSSKSSISYNSETNYLKMNAQPSNIKERVEQITEEPVDEHLDFKYQKLLDVIKGSGDKNNLGFLQQKIDYLTMISNRLQISLFDLLNLLPSKYLAQLFQDYKQQENVMVNIILASVSGLSQPNKIFEDIKIDLGDKFDYENQYLKAHCQNYEDCLNQDEQEQQSLEDDEELEELTPQIKTRIFFSRYIIPLVLHQLIDFKQDPSIQMSSILGRLEDIYGMQQSQAQLGSAQNINTQDSGGSLSQNSNASQNLFIQKVYITNLREFYRSLKFFMEKIYRKNNDKAQYVLSYLQKICKNERDYELDQTLFSYEDLKRDRIVLYRLAMSGTKKLLFNYLQDKQILTKYAGNCIFDFKKKEIFLDYYKRFITPAEASLSNGMDDTVFRISANLENYCRALQTSQHKICALRNAIALIRFLTPFLETFSSQFNQSATNKYLIKAACWRIVRFILFVHDGSISYVALVFLIFCFELLFSERSLLNQEHERFLHLLLAFLHVYRNREDALFKYSQQVATRIIMKLIKKINYNSSGDSSSLSSSRKKINIQTSSKSSSNSTNNSDLDQSHQMKDYWFLNYNYHSLDEKFQKYFAYISQKDIYSKYNYIEKELKQIQEQPLIDEQVILILSYLKNLLQEPQDFTQIKISKSMQEELKSKNLNEIQLKKEKEKLSLIHLQKIKEKKNAIYLQLLNLPKLSDNKKILAKNSHSMNALVKIKQELLVDCLGLIGPVQQHDFQENYQDILPINLTPADLKEKIKSFLNVNIFNTDIPLVSLCICKEYVENKFTGKRKKLNERIQNSFLSANEASKSQDDMEERSNMLNASFSSRGINENTNGNATNLDHSIIHQQKQQFNLMQWLAELIMKMKKQDETIKIIEGCMELMANSDLGEFLTPYIIFKYINSTENSHLEIIPVINKILEEGHHNHKLIITKTLINLDTWFRQELKQEKQQNYDPFRPQSIMHSESPKNRFIRNFAFIKRGISTQVYCKTLVEMSEHKGAIQLLEQELEQQDIQLLNLTDAQEIKNIKKLRTHYIYQLYNIYKEVNEDYKNIDVVEMMRKLDLDETEIKKYQDINLKQKNDGLCPEIYEDIVDRNFRDEESQQKLINLLSKSIPDFASQNQDFAFQKYLRSICWGFQKILNYEKNNSFDNMFQQLKSAIQKLKYAFSLQLVNAKCCYDSKFSVLVKIQVLLNVETMLKIQKFQKDYSKLAKNGDIIFDQTSFSFDESQPDYLLKLTVKSNSQGFPNNNTSSLGGSRITYNQIINQYSVFNLIQALQQTSKLLLSYDQECYLRIVYNYLICVLYNQCKEYRKIYINSLFRLSKYYYKKEKYSDALTILKRAKQVWKEKKDSFSSQEIYTLQAKIEKKLGNIKKAIHKLQKFDGIDFKIKKVTYKYQHNFQIFSESLIHSEFIKLVQQNSESEKLCFKYAKFIDENELISDNPNDKEIDQKIKAIQLYLLAASNGHQYIHQSLPRAIRLLVELFQDVANLQTKKAQLVKQKFDKNFLQISETCNKIETFKLTSVVNQLTSHITIPYQQCANLFIDLLAKVGAEYPDQSVWWLLPLKYMYQMISNQSSVQKDEYTEQRASAILKKINEINPSSYEQINRVSNFYYNLLNFAIKAPDGSSTTMKIENYLVKSLANLRLILPKKEYIFPKMPQSRNVEPNYNPYHNNPVYMEKFDDVVRIMSSKQKPKLLTVQCSDGTKKKFLIKSQTQSENVYEQRTSELISFLNLILYKEQLGFYEMPSYTILRLNSQSCIVEWVDDTLTLKTILDQLWQEKKQKSQFYQLKLDSDKLSREEWNKQKSLPSVFQDFFNQRFLDSQQWYTAKENYLRTYASWCILGYLIGLGDRHTDNILIKKINGEIVHIDYALIFGSGKQLNVPETIPFRLTKNMEFALGSFKSYGLFRKAMIDICMCFSKHLDDIIGFWDCFTNELEGCKKTNFNQLCNQIKNRIKMTNFKSTEEGIDSLIQISKDDYCLRDMFKGWWPHA
ncbi:phosphatidylinositol 3-kinase (macronuclear) [Tetrahymena thermophila SB210]|uniref:Serine/threonine-protein kinase ATR n=1 Tax=Tetrahymena thermophila (strain SB210) TaxID=312017 RepID=Q24FA9_TETTS|nr:phosphatidylinositol 3-kinase [Tetrahymena thermophila SB210]EAS06453.2 phosphatidylinositol 3-kinase [Tetrahymena thermophila SB210]|eukprot:XP_001026698.2 phosphatidylinositol 3-kinase [Tetrahymena thermophila SB210]